MIGWWRCHGDVAATRRIIKRIAAAGALMWTLVIAQVLGAITFATVAQGSSSQIQQPREVIVRSASEWERVWEAHSPTRRPDVDFTQSVVVGVFLGMRRTAGYRVDITAITREEDQLVVEYQERGPSPDDVVAQVLTAPFHLVTLSAPVEPIVFRAHRSDTIP